MAKGAASKISRRGLIRFYKNLLFKERIKIGGSAHKRLKHLEDRYDLERLMN